MLLAQITVERSIMQLFKYALVSSTLHEIYCKQVEALMAAHPYTFT